MVRRPPSRDLGVLSDAQPCVVAVSPLLGLAPNWRSFLATAIPEEDVKLLRAHERTGRPLGEEAFLASLEQDLGRILRRQVSRPSCRNVPGTNEATSLADTKRMQCRRMSRILPV